MKNHKRTSDELISELTHLRQQLAELQRTEGVLRQSEAKWRSVAENAPLSLTVVERSGKMLFLNRFVAGFDPASVLGRPIYDFLQPEYHAVARECLEYVFRSGDRASYQCVGAGPGNGLSDYVTDVAPVIVDGEIIAATLISTDVTQRRQAEAALRESEERFKLFMENSPAIAWMKDDQGRYVYINKACERRIGVLFEDRLGKTDFELWPSETAEQFWRNDQEVLASGHVVEVIEESPTADGSLSYCRNFKFPFQDSKGRRFVGGVGIDITRAKQAEAALQNAHDDLERRVAERTAELVAVNERLQHEVEQRRQAEDALRESEMRLRQAMRIGKSYAFEWDPITDVAIRSPECAAILGLNDDEVLYDTGKTFFQRIVADDRPRLREAVIGLSPASNTYTVNYRLARGDGMIVTLQETARGFFDDGGRLMRLLGTVADVTEQRRAEEVLRQSHDELKAIYDQAVDGIIIVRAETGNPVRTNAAYCRMLGYSEEEVYKISPEKIHPPEVLPEVWKHLDAVQKGVIARLDDLPFLRKDGLMIYADVVSSPIYYNKWLCWISFFHDVTERKHAQESLERERQSLWRMLQASDHERQIISYEIHDGLAQYLAAAGMQFQAYDSLKDHLPAEARTAYETALQLVRQAHAESRRLISEVRPPVIDEIGLETAISHLVHEQRKRGGPKIEFHSDVQFGKLLPILENALYRITQEALTNASKHSKSKRVKVTLTQEGQDVRLEVRDWGIGMDVAAVKEGHFGLEGIRQRVRLLGGRLTIESKPDSGTWIKVVVPIVERLAED